ncbi:Major Facilitator Superfamily protein [Verrucomicrobium sp. GAS474]|uniref:OFA family MFS transporter n=1 Tax=Verrucomicrobium sp. GAS474 TaxID=1882831 RepID=UPI0008792760|nr:OFA family MFS transporter [Verrucomicrobium sp. GAS474]SDU15591.1 Major Facilitator Superfamily protein [Verrucomicrobium sp. GAS474]
MSFLDRSHSVAGPGYNRWLVPPAALAIHLCIGEVYGFSVFKLPLASLLGTGGKPGAGDWTQTQIAWVFSIAIVFLGLSAAVFGKWMEKNGPRKAMFAAACCFGGGFLVASVGVRIHSLSLIYLGYGVLGGIGLGLGYISPVSTLVKWFPDRPGMATGMAIMGFGGGAMIGGPLAVLLMKHFSASPTHGVAPAMVVMGIVYFLFMLFGVFTVRVPAPGWAPAGYVPPAESKGLITKHNVSVDRAWRTPQFWCLWVVLCFNVTAGIGILEQASPMIQEMLLVPRATAGIDPADTASIAAAKAPLAAVAAGFVGLLSLFNMGGRFFWSSISDYIGRKPVYFIYLLLGPVLYCLIPVAGRAGSVGFFVLLCVLILTMYGGGFATVPAYLKDLFGSVQVGAIHGRLLTAWSVAGVLGPLLVNKIRESQIAAGATGVERYAPTMYLMAGLLVVGAICNGLVRPVDSKNYLSEEGSKK